MTDIRAMPELMATASDGSELWREMRDGTKRCTWCGAGCWYSWRDHDALPLGWACSVLCMQRRLRADRGGSS